VLARFPISRLPLSRPADVNINAASGIGPDDAALIAVYLNPALRAIRDRRGLANAQLVQAGVLPNPVVSYGRDYVIGGNTAGTTDAFNFTANWEISSLIPLLMKRTAARTNAQSVDLDIAWNEWQVAEAARVAVYRVVALRDQLGSARQADQELKGNAERLQRAVQANEKTVLDYAAAESASQESRAAALGLEQDFAKQQLSVKKTLGLEPTATVELRAGINLPTRLGVPDERATMEGVETRRLDLLALQRGYQSQDATVRAAILAQFPKLAVGFAKASDTTNVHTEGFAISVEVPIFDRNQGVLATERATRERLRDEYNQRAFEARSDIAAAIADIRSLNRQIAAAEEALPIFERLVRSAETAMNEGNTDVLAFYTARNSLLQKRVQLVKLKEQLLEAESALEIASGRFVPLNAAMQSR
jgi:outer membrane protein, heavy metal efflux system